MQSEPINFPFLDLMSNFRKLPSSRCIHFLDSYILNSVNSGFEDDSI